MTAADLDAYCRLSLSESDAQPKLTATLEFRHRQPNSLTAFTVLLPALFRSGTLGQTARRVSPTQSDCGPIRRPLLHRPLRTVLSETQARAIQDIITLALKEIYSCLEIIQAKIRDFL
jgi:hypothetical protein